RPARARAPALARQGLRGARGEISGRRRGADLLRPVPRGDAAAVRPDLCRLPQGRGDPREAVQEASRPSGRRALPHPQRRRAAERDARKPLYEAQQIKRITPRFVAPYALTAMPARYALERGDWRAAAGLQPRQDNFPFTVAMTHFARALGAARSGDAASAQKD